MSSLRISEPKEKVDTLQTRLRTDGYLFFLQLTKPLKEFLTLFGGLSFQEDGRQYYVVRAGERLQSDDGGSLMPHTDDFNIEGDPPRFVALHCIRPDEDGYGRTSIADGYSWLETLSPSATKLLENLWRYRKGNRWVEKPFLSAIGGHRVLRVSFGHLAFAHNEEMRKVMAGLSRWFGGEAKPVVHRCGSLLIWDNWRIIHGRNAYADLQRELHRYYLD